MIGGGIEETSVALVRKVGSLSTFSDRGYVNLAQKPYDPQVYYSKVKSRYQARQRTQARYQISEFLKACDKQLRNVDTEPAEGRGLTNLSALRNENSYET